MRTLTASEQKMKAFDGSVDPDQSSLTLAVQSFGGPFETVCATRSVRPRSGGRMSECFHCAENLRRD